MRKAKAEKRKAETGNWRPSTEQILTVLRNLERAERLAHRERNSRGHWVVRDKGARLAIDCLVVARRCVRLDRELTLSCERVLKRMAEEASNGA